MKILIVILFLYSNITYAQIHKCIDHNGKVSYSDIPCGSLAAEFNNKNKLPVYLENSKNDLLLLESKINSISTYFRKEFDQYFCQIILFVYLFMSGLCYWIYRTDKNYAKNKERRVPEKTLHAFEFFGGWPGGLIAQRTLRHKNKKFSYQIKFWLIVVFHFIVWYDYLILNQQLMHQVISIINLST